MVSVSGAAGLASPGLEVTPRIALGPGAPSEVAEFIARAGVEVVPFTQRHTAALYVDFVGARPPGVEVLSVICWVVRVPERVSTPICSLTIP
jgi:hypothetical protein